MKVCVEIPERRDEPVEASAQLALRLAHRRRTVDPPDDIDSVGSDLGARLVPDRLLRLPEMIEWVLVAAGDCANTNQREKSVSQGGPTQRSLRSSRKNHCIDRLPF
jgi:hypothetical protein